MLSFFWPWAFVLLPAPLVVYLVVPRAVQPEAALWIPFFAEIAPFSGHGQSGRVNPARALVLVGIWLLLILALARPQWTGEPLFMPVSGRDLLLAVDISGSMAEEDLAVNGRQVARIDLVKEVLHAFLERRVGDRVGLILFGTEAHVRAPLTFDRRTVKKLLDEAQIGFAGQKTSIGDAIMLAVKRLRERPAKSRVLILLTDGSNTAGNVAPRQAAELAARSGMTIYAVGVGADERIVRDLFGSHRVRGGGDLDEELLREMATVTGGRYFRARQGEELHEIYRQIDELEPAAQEEEIVRVVRGLFHWPLGAALLLSFLLALPALPRRRPSAGKEG
ncbi:MAG: vWA domain-containing protein [Thermodesulfobacteriota bacterium]